MRRIRRQPALDTELHGPGGSASEVFWMPQIPFVIEVDSLLSDPAATLQAEWYAARCPELDALDLEVHIMLTQACAALETHAPFERRGGLTKARYNLLRMLHGAEGNRKLMRDLVAELNVSATNVTKLVDGLEKDGYARRAGNDGDKRRLWVELLPAGSRVVEKTLPEVVRHVSSLWQGLSREDKQMLVHLLIKLRQDILMRSPDGNVEGGGVSEAILAKA
jgi:DNA-binding MarR family transcriptional regulator